MPIKKVVRKKTVRVHIIDGIRYKSARDVVYHNELKNNPCVKSFHLPDAEEKSKYSRYGAHKCVINGIEFDSTLEGRYYAYLLLQKKNGLIKDIKLQQSYELQPSFKDFKGKRVLPIYYISDFTLTMSDGREIVIDVKGKKTPEFRLKEKILKYINPGINFYCIQWDEVKKEWRDLDEIQKDKRARKRAKSK